VYEPVEDGVGDGVFADDVKPLGNRMLAGDDGRSASVAIFDDFHEVHPLLRIEGHEPEVVDDEEVSASNHVEEFDRLPFCVGNFRAQVQLLHVEVQYAVAVITRGLAEGTGKVALATACGPTYQKGCTVLGSVRHRVLGTILC